MSGRFAPFRDPNAPKPEHAITDEEIAAVPPDIQAWADAELGVPKEKTNGAGDNPEEHGDIGEPPEMPEPPVNGDGVPIAGLDGVKRTEDSVAEHYAELTAGRWVYDHTDKQSYSWTGSLWAADNRRRSFHDVRRFVRAVRASFKAESADTSKRAFFGNVEALAITDPRIAVSYEVWNQNPWHLGTPNGTVDLHSGELLDPHPGDYISRHTSVVPAPVGTPHPLWSAFLGTVTQQDRELECWLQKLAGYCLTGNMTEEILTFFYGPGGNGKGTFINALVSVMGTYAQTLPVEVFTAREFSKGEYYRAEMHGPRLIIASETEQQALWSEQILKDVTGNDALISGRKAYGHPFTFRPQCKIIIVGNYAPRLKSRTPAMERRLRVVPFTFVPETPDPDLKDKLRAEYPAILRWAIDGCLLWQDERLGRPDVIRKASSAYFTRQDAFGQWLEECCELGPGKAALSSHLLANFNAWAKRNGEEMLTRNGFAELLDRTPGVHREHTRTGNMVVGVAVGEPREDL